jgi:hypothetical protein
VTGSGFIRGRPRPFVSKSVSKIILIQLPAGSADQLTFSAATVRFSALAQPKPSALH